jgi:hypothetical protein
LFRHLESVRPSIFMETHVGALQRAREHWEPRSWRDRLLHLNLISDIVA